MDNASTITPSWVKALNKSKSNNEQLEFWRYINIATICCNSGLPETDLIKFRDFHLKDGVWYVAIAQDIRSKIIQNLTKNDKTELCWCEAAGQAKD